MLFCTGGSGDICSAQVKALVHLGANACIVGRNTRKAERVAREIEQVRDGAKVLAVGNVDVRKDADLERAVAECVRALGGIDFVMYATSIHPVSLDSQRHRARLYANILSVPYSAGAAGNFLSPLTQLSTNAFKSVLDIDVLGSWNTAKATLPRLLHSAARHPGSSGRIVFISSTTQYTGTQLVTHGAVAKSAVDTLSAQLAIELGPRGITSNVVAPGPIAGTEGHRRLIATGNERDRSRKIPVGRFGTLRDMGDAVVYLFSEAGSFVNGAVLVVDGGAWRTGSGQAGGGFEYPDVVKSDEPFRERLKKARL